MGGRRSNRDRYGLVTGLVSGLTRTIICFYLWLPASVAVAAIKVTDGTGETIVLSSAATKIVSLAPHITEILFELGAGDRIAGTVRFSDYPPAARDIPRVGDAFSVNVESVVGIQPDLVFAWATGGAGRAVDHLRQLGVPVYTDQSRDLEAIADSVRRISRLVGKRDKGAQLANRYLASLEEIRQREASSDTTRVFFQISDRDLYTVSKTHIMGQAIELCGGINLFADSAVPVPRVSQEAVLSANPDVIVISRPTHNNRSPWVEKWRQYENLRAEVRVIDADLISRPSLRMLDGVEALCRLIEMP